jgi:hypothetical protein
MRKQIMLATVIFTASIFFYSCQKSLDEPATLEMNSNKAAKSAQVKPDITPYQFERVNENNFFSQGWKEQQVNIVSGTTVFSDQSDYVEIVCGPENNSDPRLIKGCITMNLPTSDNPTLRRVRLRRGGYSGTRLADLTELKYSTYVVNNAPTIMVLQIDVNGDEMKDLNIYYDPQAYHQEEGFPPVVLNTWQQWDALHQGVWHIEAATIPLAGELEDDVCTIQEMLSEFPGARIIDTPPMGHNGEGVRFTIGGTPSYLYANTIGYFDTLIIGTKNQQHSTLFDFTCNNSNH